MNDIGLFGLGVMGQSLASNILSKDITLSVYNIDYGVSKEFTNKNSKAECFEDVKSFVNSLEKPRKIILMITAGKPIDDVCKKLEKYLDKNDIIIDCGNSYYLDTEMRQKRFKKKDIYFIGAGVSGGEKGALLGPSIMPSGELQAYNQIKYIFEKIAAKNDNGSMCCSYIGKDGAGHFVKMVHNGIEYADMQLIAEAYAVLKNVYNFNNEKISDIFAELNKGVLKSYLLEITSNIFKKKENNKFLIDLISDIAHQKGTGKWTALVSLNYGIAIPSIIEAVESRFISMMKEERHEASKIYKKKREHENFFDIKRFEHALYISKISIYAQGFSLIEKVSEEKKYYVDLRSLANIWENGCIIKSKFLEEIVNAYNNENSLKNLIFDTNFNDYINQNISDLKFLLLKCNENSIYAPVFSSSLNYIFGITCNNLSTNLVQAQRDYFGAHTYERNDADGVFHTEWE